MEVQYNNRLRGRTVMVLPTSCPHSVVVTMGNCRYKINALDIPWAGRAVVTKCEISYENHSFVTTPQPGK